MNRHLVSALAVASALVSGEASAQAQAETAKDGAAVADIVVTAQRRSESVQKTALAISVVSGSALAERGIAQPDQLTQLAPGVQVGGGSSTQVYIRGVGDFGVVATANPAVVTSLNGVSIARPQAISGNFYDLERVEILKGPQGTLYGRNASGGALNLLAVKPKLGELSGYFNGSSGTYNALSGDGAINLPVGRDVALRVSGQVTRRDGYLSDSSDDDKHQSLRAQALVDKGPLKVHLLTSYTHLGGVGSGLAVIPSIPGQSPWTGTSSTVASNYFFSVVQANLAASGGASPPAAVYDPLNTYPLFQNIKSFASQAQIDYDLGGATVTVIPAYRWTHAAFAIEPYFNYAPGGQGTDGERSQQYSLETRLGNSGPHLKWVVGAFAYQEDQSTDFMVNTGLLQRFHIFSNLRTKSIAGFGEATYSLAPALRVTAGLRFTSDERSLTNFRKDAVSPTVTGYPGPLAVPCLPSAGFAVGSECDLLGNQSYDSSRTFNKATWRAGFEGDLAPESMAFANVATGFKAGGFNQAIDPQNTSKLLPFDPETITAYTVGLRNRFLDRKLQVNFEGFYWNYNNLQLTRLILDGSGNLALTTQNAGKARIYGLSTDVVARPFRGTTIHAALEYVNAKYVDFSFDQAAALTLPGATGCATSPSSLAPSVIGPFVTINCSGKPLVRSPKWAGNAGITQAFELAGDSKVTFDANVDFASSRYTSTSFVSNALVKGYGNVSLAVTFYGRGDRWFVGGYVRNVTNATVYTGGGGDEAPTVPGFVTSTIGAPRTWGARFGFKF